MIKKALLTFCFMLMVFLDFSQEKDEIELIKKINERPYPEWFKDAKLGIFVHWGLYSVPAYGGKESYAERFLRGLQLKDSLRTNFVKNTYGENFTYKDFAPLFKVELKWLKQ